jgi:hypothetical protein
LQDVVGRAVPKIGFSEFVGEQAFESSCEHDLI